MGGFFSRIKYMGWVLDQSFPPKSQFSTDQIPDLSGRVVIVTGANTGIGKYTVQALLEHDAKVYIAVRNKEKAEKAISELKEVTGKDAIFLELDLASLASVRKAAQEFLSKEKELHILFNNAGVLWPPIELLTEDGFDMQWGTNVVGHFLFTELLLPALEAGAKTSPDNHSRVVTTSSCGAYFQSLHYDTFNDSPERKKFGRENLYYQSKLGNAMVAREASKRYANKGILSMSCHPGLIKTEIFRHVPTIQDMIVRHVAYSAPFGALTQLWAGTMPETAKYNGEFLIPWARVGKCRHEVYDAKETEKLWAWLEDAVREKPNN